MGKQLRQRRREAGATAALSLLFIVFFFFSLRLVFEDPTEHMVLTTCERASPAPTATVTALPLALNPADARRRWPLHPSSPRLATDALFALALPGRSAVPRRRSSAAPAVRSTVWVRADTAASASADPSPEVADLFGELLTQMGNLGRRPSRYFECPHIVIDDRATVNRSFIDAVFVLPPKGAVDHALLQQAIGSVKRHGNGLIRHIILVCQEASPLLISAGADRVVSYTELDVSKSSTRTEFNAFSEAWVEARLHRLQGLSRFFLFFQPNMLLGRDLSFFDLFRPVLASPARHREVSLLDAITLQRCEPALRAHTWAPSNGPIVRTIDGATYFEFEPIVYAEKKHRFADCTIHNEEHGRAPGSAYCFYKYHSTLSAPPARDPELWKLLSERVLRSVCWMEPSRGTEGMRLLTDGHTYDVEGAVEPDPCQFVTPEAYYDAYVTLRNQSTLDAEHRGTSAVEAEVNARAWEHFKVFPWHKDASVPRLVDRNLLSVVATLDVYGILTSLHSARLISDHGQHLTLAERRAALAADKGVALPVCTLAQDLGRRLQGAEFDWHGDRDDWHLCIESENDFAFGVDSSRVPRDALEGEETGRESDLFFSKLFRAVVPIGKNRRQHANTSRSVAEVLANRFPELPLFFTMTK